MKEPLVHFPLEAPKHIRALPHTWYRIRDLKVGDLIYSDVPGPNNIGSICGFCLVNEVTWEEEVFQFYVVYTSLINWRWVGLLLPSKHTLAVFSRQE